VASGPCCTHMKASFGALLTSMVILPAVSALVGCLLKAPRWSSISTAITDALRPAPISSSVANTANYR
jgi:hypothetical protein